MTTSTNRRSALGIGPLKSATNSEAARALRRATPRVGSTTDPAATQEAEEEEEVLSVPHSVEEESEGQVEEAGQASSHPKRLRGL